MSWKGSFAAGDTIDFKFSTRRFNTGAPFTLAGTPAVSVYKGNSTTQSTAGITLTVDFDSVTGLNHVRIDTTADGTFYADGSQFDVVITAGTVDSVSVVGEAIGRFELRAAPATAAALATVQADTDDIQSRLPAALVGGRIDASVGAMANNVMTAAAAAADLTTELQAGLSTLDAADVRAAVGLASANLDTQLAAIDDFLDTEVAAIKAKTDLLPSVAAGAANGLLINGANTGPLSISDGVTISNSAGDALTLTSSGANGSGLKATANGSGSAVHGVGGTTGHGFLGVGGATSGAGMRMQATAGNSNGFEGLGSGTGDGMMLTGGSTGHGLHSIGGITSGAGIAAKGRGGNAHGLECIADGTGDDLAADNIATAAQATAIEADTNELQTDWANGGRLDLILDARASQTSVDDLPTNAELATALAAADDAVLAAIDAVPTATENADALLNRDMAAVSDTNSRSPLNALRVIRNGFTITGTTLTALKEDDLTAAYTRDLTTDASAVPITGVS